MEQHPIANDSGDGKVPAGIGETDGRQAPGTTREIPTAPAPGSPRSLCACGRELADHLCPAPARVAELESALADAARRERQLLTEVAFAWRNITRRAIAGAYGWWEENHETDPIPAPAAVGADACTDAGRATEAAVSRRDPVTTPRPGDVLLGPDDGIVRTVLDCTGTRVEYTTGQSYPYRFNTTLPRWAIVAAGSQIVRLAEGA